HENNKSTLSNLTARLRLNLDLSSSQLRLSMYPSSPPLDINSPAHSNAQFPNELSAFMLNENTNTQPSTLSTASTATLSTASTAQISPASSSSSPLASCLLTSGTNI